MTGTNPSINPRARSGAAQSDPARLSATRPVRLSQSVVAPRRKRVGGPTVSSTKSGCLTRSGGKRSRLASTRLLLQPGQGDALDQVALEEEEDEENRRQRHG